MAVSATLIAAAGSTTAGTSVATGSVALPADKVVYLWASASNSTTAQADKPTPAAVNGNTWAEVADTNYGGGNRFRSTLWRTVLTSPYTGTVTINVSSSQASFQWIIVSLDGTPTGSNGAAAQVQVASGGSSTAAATFASPLSLSAFADAGNATLAFMYCAAGTDPTVVNDATAGWTQLGETTTGRTVQAQFNPGNDTSVNWSWTGNQVYMGAAVELSATSVVTSDPVLVATYTSVTAKDQGVVDTAVVNADTGDVLVLSAVADNRGGSTESLETGSVTDSGGNTWTRVIYSGSTEAALTASDAAVYVCTVTAPLSAGTVTLTCNALTAAKAFVVDRWTGLTATVRGTAVGAGGTSTSPSVTHAGPNDGDVVYGVVGVEGPTVDTTTADADSSSGSWSAQVKHGTNAGTDVSNIYVARQYKVVTATASQTYNPTITSRDWQAVTVTFQPGTTVAPSGEPDYIHVQGIDPTANDYTIEVDFVVLATTAAQQRVVWRGQTDGSYYAAELAPDLDTMTVYSVDGDGVRTEEHSEALAVSVADVVHVKVNAVGTAHKVRWWLNAASEPGTWDIEFTDATLTDGYVGLGAAADTELSFDFDDFTLTL
jgi:hypothetical protein